MGEKARTRRKAEKQAYARVLRLNGWRENEFGDLTKRMTKAEARRILVRRFKARYAMEGSLMDLMARKVKEEVWAQLDAEMGL